MLTLFSKTALFLSSYAPLWVIFAAMNYRMSAIIFYVSVALFVIGMALTILVLNHIRSLEGQYLKVASIRKADHEIMSYIASYLIPFASTTFEQPEQVFSLCVFLAVLYVVYVNSDMIHINPTFSLLGYRLYEVEDHEGKTYSLITRHKQKNRTTIKIVHVEDDILWDITNGN